jgi:hypothetical protein
MGWDDLDDSSGVGGIPLTSQNALTLQVIIRDWARLGMAGDEKGTGESYEKARPQRAVQSPVWLLMAI